MTIENDPAQSLLQAQDSVHVTRPRSRKTLYGSVKERTALESWKDSCYFEEIINEKCHYQTEYR